MPAKVWEQRETVLAIFTLVVLLSIGVLVYTQKLRPSIGCITGFVILTVAVILTTELTQLTQFAQS